MNVSEGDLARIVGHPNNAMAIVSVVRLCLDHEGSEELMRPAWLCEALSPVTDCITGAVAMPGKAAIISDCALRPLYGGDAPDESLSWAKVPSEPAEMHPKQQQNLWP